MGFDKKICLFKINIGGIKEVGVNYLSILNHSTHDVDENKLNMTCKIKIMETIIH